MAVYLSPNLELPWSSSIDEDRRYQRILRVLLVLVLLFGLVIPFVPVPEPARDEQAQLPPQLARVILERQQEPPPPPPPEPPPPEERPPEPERAPEPTPTPEPVPEPVAQPQQPDPATVARARERAAASGLLQMRDELAEMRSAFQAPVAETAPLSRGEARATEVERSRLSSQIETASGGVSDAELSRDAGGAALAGRETTQVESTLAAARVEEPPAAGARETSARSSEEIRRVIDQHMGAIFAIYNRALRQNPALQGKVVVRLVIEPAGNLSAASVVSSELDDPELEARLIARILLITFPAANVSRTTVNYTFDFLPR